MFQVEFSLRERGYPYVIGSDDVGRGAIAGPIVTASCCILHSNTTNTIPPMRDTIHPDLYDICKLIQDSKILTEQERNFIDQKVKNRPDLFAFSYAYRSSQDIDQMNVQKASMECFVDSIESLVSQYSWNNHEMYSIVDGKKSPKLKHCKIPCRPFVKGDRSVLTISLASILAKVERDRFMVQHVHGLFPQYGFDVNKGYATTEHILAIHKYGPTPFHRMSFRQLKGRSVLVSQST